MHPKVYYQDGKVTITDKLLVTKNNSHQLSAITGLSSQLQILYAVLGLGLGASAVLGISANLSAGMSPAVVIPATLVVVAVIGVMMSLLPNQKLVATLTSGGKAVLVDNITQRRARAIIHAFTLAKANA